MIYTVTVNPAIDYIIEVDTLRTGEINPYREPQYAPGGKGVNVSLMLCELGVPNTAFGICSGFSGEEILRLLRLKGCTPDFVTGAVGHSRINVKICAGDRRETDFNGNGPALGAGDIEALLRKFETVTGDDCVVLAGSIPTGVNETLYAEICGRLAPTRASVVVDAVGQALLHTLPHRPFLIKPNHEELGMLFGVEIETPQQAEAYGRKLLEQGARNVLVSMGGKGALLLDAEGESLFLSAAPGETVSTVGAGDSMVAGFLYGYIRSGSKREALKWGVAAGGATAFTKSIAAGDAVRAVYERLPG